jgi:hypothetical protein
MCINNQIIVFFIFAFLVIRRPVTYLCIEDRAFQ